MFERSIATLVLCCCLALAARAEVGVQVNLGSEHYGEDRKQYNERNVGGGISYTRGLHTLAVGEYHNSHGRDSTYISWSRRTVGDRSLGVMLVTGYDLAVTPAPFFTVAHEYHPGLGLRLLVLPGVLALQHEIRFH